MAGPTIDTGDVFPPYRIEKDPLHTTPRVLRYYEVSLEGIPPTPSTVPAVHDEDENGNKQNDFISKIEGVTSDTSSEDIKSVLEEFASLKLDINRLARFAICRNAVKVVEYLVKKAGADLNGNDTKNRSAGCYAMWDYPDDQMFEFLASTLAQLENVTPQNYWGGNALRFAITFKCFGALSFLLRQLYPDVQITDEITDEWATQCGPVWGKNLVEAWFLRSLLGFKLERRVPPLFCVSARRDAQISLWLRDGDGSWRDPPVWFYDKDRTFVWMHLPWANGIPFFFALRRYGQDVGCPTLGTDWLPSLFRQPFKAPRNPDLPYSDPVYESSFGTTFGDVSRVFMIFPCLVLRSKRSHKEARDRINSMRAKMQSKLAQSMLEPELTLDEVVSRKYKGTNSWGNTDRTPMLMVAQIWIWRSDSYILTAFSENDPEDLRHLDPEYPVKFITNSDIFVSQTPVSPCVQMGLILRHQISEFDNPQADGEFCNPQESAKFPSLLDIFKESTARVLEGAIEHTDLSIQPQSKYGTKATAQPRLDIRKEQKFMFEIVDIREELAMINQVLEQQFEVLQAFIEDSERYDPDLQSCPDHEATPKLSEADKDEIADKTSKADKETMKKKEAEKKKWNQVKCSKTMIKKYQKRVKKIDEDAARVEKQIQYQLDLKSAYASMQDAYASVVLGIAGLRFSRAGLTLSIAGLILSIAVAGFTIITIIFAPLAFVTALFALPIDVLLSNQVPFDRLGNSQAGGDVQATVAYSTGYIGTWFAVAELVSLTVTVLLIALCVGPFRKFSHALQENFSETNPDENIPAAGEAGVRDSTLGQEQTNLRGGVRLAVAGFDNEVLPSTFNVHTRVKRECCRPCLLSTLFGCTSHRQE